jgi:hypothetical protein
MGLRSAALDFVASPACPPGPVSIGLQVSAGLAVGVNGAGKLLIADTANNRIRIVTG